MERSALALVGGISGIGWSVTVFTDAATERKGNVPDWIDDALRKEWPHLPWGNFT